MKLFFERGLLALLGALCVLGARPAAADAAASPSALGPAALPGARAPGLRYFRLQPATADTVYRLLVVPVRFPEDADLGITRSALAGRLNGDGIETLSGYWSAATYGRIRFEVTLAPTVTAAHSRAYYTSEGAGNTGYGIDPDAYPHNSQGLVAEVTATLADRVDFRLFDNTADGIADGLLVLHSGPAAPEILDPELPPTVMLAHAFTLPEPVARGPGTVFPYAVASVHDAVGPWAHETGHLLGLVDLYVSNPLCPGEGLGEWSLMATGANREGGAAPGGLDALSRQILGFEPAYASGPGTIPIAGGSFARVFRAGEAHGHRYFLVERRDGADGLPVPETATLILYVNEDAVDNRNCVNLLAQVRATVCPGTAFCDETLTDDTEPGLRDGAGNPTGLVLHLTGSTAEVGPAAGAPFRFESARLLDPHPAAGGGTQLQPVEVTVRNLTDAALGATLSMAPLTGGPVCAAEIGTSRLGSLPPGGAAADTSWVLRPCSGTGDLAAVSEAFVVTLLPEGGGLAAIDTLVLAVNGFGLPGSRLGEFTAVNLAAPRRDPWAWDGSAWRASAIAPLADAEIVSPWFTVPEAATLVLDHAWDLDALAPDAVLDAGRVEIEVQTGPREGLLPPGGWGWTAERGTGNALGGAEVLSGSGDRVHVFDLSPYARRTVRVALRVTGDVDESGSSWSVRAARVLPAPPVSFTLREEPEGSRRFLAEPGGVPESGTALTLYGGPAAVTAVTLVGAATASAVDTFQASDDPVLRRFELVWTDPAGRSGTRVVTAGPPVTSGPPLRVHPNPFHRGGNQTWSSAVSEGAPGGRTVFQVLDVAGRKRLERSAVFAVPGPFAIGWDGRDGVGRELGAGVYFLRMVQPGGGVAVRRIVLLP
jgi:M6 family metalloprotease-like protein